MTAPALSVLWVGAKPPPVPPDMAWAQAGDASGARALDAVVFEAADRAALQALVQQATLAQTAFESAVLVLTPVLDDALETALLDQGVQAIAARSDDAALLRGIRHAVVRKRAERAARHAYATDLATGLPHQAQLVEHMTQLLALRERLPAPMVLVVLHIEGYAQAAQRLGAEAANILRRKIAVRLRGLLRASDVVAAIGPDAFGVLLGHVDAKTDGQRVAGKLVRALQQPVPVAGQACTVAASVGLAVYPDHGKDADSLLKHASAQAGSVATLGSQGFAARAQRGDAPAANDDAS